MASKTLKQPRIKPINNFLMLFILSVFQVATGFIGASCHEDFESKAFLALLCLVALEWVYFIFFYTAFHRRNFELELIAFFLSGVGLVTIGSVYPDSAFKQFFMVLAGVIGFTVLVFLLGHVDFCMKIRPFIAGAAILLLIVNLAIAGTTNGARNWITLGGEGGITVQPSEFVKIAFIFVGAATLEKIQTSKNIIAYIVFSALCVGSLILMRDFGTALIFFITFLIIAFMTSGDIKTIILAVASAVMGAAIVLKYKAYVLRRFSVYRHVWDDPFGWGMQQTRVLVGIASGGLFGVGIGRGYVRTYYAPVSDSIFGVICEEWGLIFGIALVLSFVAIAISALINSVASRSAFYSIAAIAGAGLLLFQCGLNVFGITDILPLTGVTIPFISLGGSSMISCWAILAFIKAADVRTYNYLGAKKAKKEGAK